MAADAGQQREVREETEGGGNVWRSGPYIMGHIKHVSPAHSRLR